MARDDYYDVAIQTYRRTYGEQSKHEIRARPLPGHPIGTCFIVRATVKRREGGPPFLYTSWQWRYRKVSISVARTFVRAHKR